MNVGIKKAVREKLTGKNVKMLFYDVDGNPYHYDVSIDKYLGEGTSSISYEVTVKKDKHGIGSKRVLKQFYPDPRLYELDTEMDGLHLEIKGYSEDREESQNKELTRLGELFERTYAKQLELSNRKDLEGVVVKPDMCYFNGATKYVLYEADYGKSLDVTSFRTIEDFVNMMYDLAFDLQRLHSQEILYMDLKPENILLSGNGNVKLFDFDSSIDKKNLKDVHIEDIRYAADIPELIAPEIRPAELSGEFEQNKGLILQERVDIYAFGAIMLSYFLHRYPTSADCEREGFRDELKGGFSSRFRGELTEGEQELLSNIIWRCIQKNIGIRKRYNQTEELVADLNELKRAMIAPDIKRQKVYNKVGGRLQAAYVMDAYPLSGYRKRKTDKSWILDALIIGDEPIGEDFFSNILACSQMLDTTLRIRLAVTSARKEMEEYISRWPLLIKSTDIYLNDEYIEPTSFLKETDTACKQIVKIPFAEICFYDWEYPNDPVSLYTSLEHHEDISWIVMCDSQIDKNLEMSERLAKVIDNNDEKVFIAYLDERGDGFDLRKSDKQFTNIKLFPFSDNDKYSLSEKEFETGIKKQARLLHKYYMKEWNERADKKAVWRDFSSDAYNINSSLCSVLSIPYKLESIFIRTTGEAAAAEYKKDVLDETNPLAKKKINRLIYLEHRRWMCFMLTEGYDKPSEQELEQYAFQKGNNQRNKKDKLHSCICDCGVDNGIQLDHFSHESWENPNFEDYARAKGMTLDDLDIMSVNLHQLCDRRIRQMRAAGVYKIAFAKLEKGLKEGTYSPIEEELLSSLKIILKKMLDNESNVNSLWEKICSEFEETIIRKEKSLKIHSENILKAFRELVDLMRIVTERNKYHDYKSSDRTILEVLPLLLIADHPIRRIYKPIGEETWQNLASSIIIEPEQLYLYADDESLVDETEIRNFLEKERGIDIKIIQIKKMEELKNINMTSKSVKSVLDITGLSPEKTYQLAQFKHLSDFPVIIFQDGKIKSIKGESEADYYKVIRRHITVNETFRLHHAKVYSENEQNYMLSLVGNYENIWSAYIQMNSFRYRVLVETLNQIERSHYWKLDRKNYTENVHTFEKRGVVGNILRDTGIDKLLDDLGREGWIEAEIIVPGSDIVGTVNVKTNYQDIKIYLEKMFCAVEREPYMHKFVYLKTRRQPLSGKPLPEENIFIYDDTLLVNELLEGEPADTEHKEERKDILKTALKCLKDQKSKNGECMIIDSYGGNPHTLIEDISDDAFHFRMRFLYHNRATKECLLKEGNILEAYVYHSIWKNTLVDDVKLNVEFTWDAETSEDYLKEGALMNKIDLVCTRNMQTFFISCKQSMPRQEYLWEIKYYADYFGIDGKAILITSNEGTTKKQNNAKLIEERSKKMGVYYIDRQMIGDEISDMKQDYLSTYLQNIFDRKLNWKDIVK